jgi:hypothetical protein
MPARPLRARIISMNSRAAPRPPALFKTTVAARRAAGVASAGQAERAAASNIGMSGSSSPIAAVSEADSASLFRTASSFARLSRTPW